MISIVLIEDDSIMASAVKLQLKVILDIEYSLRIFNVVSRAIEYIDNNDCDIIISDLNLPDSKGSDTINQLDNLDDSINVIFMSGSSDEVETNQIRKAPHIHFIMKDMDFNESMWHLLSKLLKLNKVI